MADTDPVELERRIERTRAELAQTVDAIAERVSPKNVARRTAAKAGSGARRFLVSVTDRVGETMGAAPRRAEPGEEPGEVWAEEPPDLGPVLIGVGAVLAVAAMIVLWRRRR